MKINHRFILAAVAVALFAFASSNAKAQTEPTISYQGLLESNGAPMNGQVSLKILIYTAATGGTPYYSETQTVDVTNGIFNVMIGSVTPLLPKLDFRSQYYLALSVNGGAELSPRSPVSFVPYAFRALNSDTASYSTTAARATIASGVAGGVVTNLNGFYGPLTLSGTNGITVTNTPSTITISNGGVQSVNTSAGKLTLVGTGGTTIADTGTTITIHSQTFTGGTGIQAVQNSDGTLTITNGSGPTATINLAHQNASPGQVLSWSGSAWQPITLPTGVQPDSIKDLGDARVVPGGPTIGTSYYLGSGAGVNSTGAGDAALGYSALYSSTTGKANVAVGAAALANNTTGTYNVAVGYSSLTSNTYGSENVAVGESSMGSAGGDSSYGNTACGARSLIDMNSGTFNTAVGYGAGSACYTGSWNVAVGADALEYNIKQSYLVAVGDGALCNNRGLNELVDSATCNTAIGSKSLFTNSTGAYNTATGFHSLYDNSVGYRNTALGYSALNQNVTGNDNTAIGDSTGPTSSSLNNTTSIGSGARATVSNEVVIGNGNVTSLYCLGAYAATTANSANLVVTSTGQIMRSTSSARYKTNIHDLDINTDRLYDLRPVSYTSKMDGKEYFGLVAEDVAKVIPQMAEYARSKDVVPGSNSDALIPDAVKYPMLSVLLLQELKKVHTQLEAQQRINADLERRLEALEVAQRAAK